jgi:heme-degrading monooxygenase HmoA
MVLEHAVIHIKLGVSREFEEAVAEGKSVVAESEGFISLNLSRCIESPDSYLLMIQWRSLEDHTVGFRESERFTRWREIVGPYFESSPEVLHLAPVEGLAA